MSHELVRLLELYLGFLDDSHRQLHASGQPPVLHTAGPVANTCYRGRNACKGALRL